MIHPSFILASNQRCGTTLVQQIINCHPQLALTKESHWIPDLVRGGLWFQKYHENWDCGEKLEPSSKWYEAIRCLNSSLFPELHSRRWGLQIIGGNNAEFASEIFTLYRDVKVVLLLRDPRDLYLSHLRVSTSYNPGASAGGRHLLTFINAARDLGLSRLIMRYEDLVMDPANEIGRLCDFLEVSYEASMMIPLTEKVSWAEETALVNQDLASRAPTGNRSLVSRWKRQLMKEELLFLDDQTDVIERLGYPVEKRERIPLQHNIFHSVSGDLIGMKASGSGSTQFEEKLPEAVDMCSCGTMGIRFNDPPEGAHLSLGAYGELRQSPYLHSGYFLTSVNGKALDVEDPKSGFRTLTPPRLFRELKGKGIEKLFLYSAGGATRLLLQRFPSQTFGIQGIIDTYQTGSMETDQGVYPIFSLEEALVQKPDFILVTSEPFYPEIKGGLEAKGLVEKDHFVLLSPKMTSFEDPPTFCE